MLYFAFAQRAIHDMPVAFYWIMIFLTFPTGLVIMYIFGVIIYVLTEVMGLHFWQQLHRSSYRLGCASWVGISSGLFWCQEYLIAFGKNSHLTAYRSRPAKSCRRLNKNGGCQNSVSA